MTQAQTNEIFGNNENELKLKEKFEKDGYKWEEVKIKLEEIRQKEEIDNKLSELEGNTEEYYNYLKGLVEKYKTEEKGKDETLVDKAKNKIEEEKKKLKDDLIAKTKNIPVIGGLLFKALNWVDESKKENKEDGFKEKTKKGFFGFLGGTILLVFGGFIGYDKFKKEFDEVEQKIKDGLKNGKNEVSEAIQNAKEKGKNLITPEKRIEAYSVGGLTLIKYLSGVNFDKENTPPGSFYSRLKDIPLKKISDSYEIYKKDNNIDGYNVLVNDLGLKGIVGPGDQKGLENALDSIVGDNSKNIISGRLSNFHELINKKDSIDKFGKEFVDNVSSKSSYEELTLKEISILFAISTPAFVKEIGVNISSTVGGMYGDIASEAEAMKEEFIEKREDLVSKKLLSNFISTSFGTNGLISASKEDILKAFGEGLSPNEIKQLEKIVEFKDTIIEKIINNPNFTFNMSSFKENFMSHIRYNSIVELYMLLNGDVNNLETLDLVSKVGVIFIIRDSFKDKSLMGRYEGAILSELKKTVGDSSSLLTEQEKLFIKIHLQKFSEKTISEYVKIISQARGGIKEFLKTEIETVMETTIPPNATNIGEYALLASAAGILWKIKSFTPAGAIWTGVIGLGIWGLSILTETELYKNWMDGKIKFSKEVEDVLNNIKEGKL